MPFVVTGISQDGNTAALEQALKAAGLSLDAFEVIGPNDAEAPSPGGGTIGRGSLLGGLETGTGVPGLTGRGVPGITSASRVRSPVPAAGDSLWDRLADLAIPDDEVDNYAGALEAHRSIFAYRGDARNVAQVEGLFGGAGLAKIKTF